MFLQHQIQVKRSVAVVLVHGSPTNRGFFQQRVTTADNINDKRDCRQTFGLITSCYGGKSLHWRPTVGNRTQGLKLQMNHLAHQGPVIIGSNGCMKLPPINTNNLANRCILFLLVFYSDVTLTTFHRPDVLSGFTDQARALSVRLITPERVIWLRKSNCSASGKKE